MKNKWNHYGVAAMFTLAVGASLVLAAAEPKRIRKQRPQWQRT